MLYTYINSNLPQKGVIVLINNFIAPIIVGIIVGAINTLFSYYLNNRKTKKIHKKHLHKKNLHKK